ncbi:MAG: LCP family protein [Clostridium sp.]|nr:LCP family protein [Clostridium sp.]
MKAKRMKDNKEQNINEEEYKYGAYERKLERAEYKIKKKNKGLKIFLRVLIVIIVIILGIAIAGYSFVHSKLSKMKTEYIDKTAIGISEEAKDSLKGYRNIALLGIDSRADDYGTGNRSDCIIIASINEKTKEVKLLSVYRDTYVYVTENGNKKLDKITHAYSYGGAQNTLKSLNEALDLNITEYVTVNFDAVIAAVNALNGVEIDITSEELKYINDYIDATSQSSGIKSSHLSKAGRQTVDGVQAVAYSRIRYTAGGDYKRTERMRTVVTAMAKKAKTLSIGQLNKLADEILPRVSKNIENNDIIALIPSALSFDIIESLGWPYNVKGITTTAWYGVPVTLESNVIRLHKELFGQEDYKVSETVKEMNDAIIKKTGYTE